MVERVLGAGEKKRLRHAGFESATFGFVDRCCESETPAKQGVSGPEKSDTASTPDNLGQETPSDPELQTIIEKRPSLSEPHRAAFLWIVRNAMCWVLKIRLVVEDDWLIFSRPDFIDQNRIAVNALTRIAQCISA